MLRRLSAIGLVVVVQACMLWGVTRAQAARSTFPYPKMLPLEQYLMDRNAEIALARSAAPPAIANQAEVLVLGREGYVTAEKGSNGRVPGGARVGRGNR